MEELQEKIDNLCTSLEDAYEEKDWSGVQSVIDRLDELYEDLERTSSGFGDDY
jgi:archaellum component FlaC